MSPPFMSKSVKYLQQNTIISAYYHRKKELATDLLVQIRNIELFLAATEKSGMLGLSWTGAIISYGIP